MLASRPKDSSTYFQTVQNGWYHAEFQGSIQLPRECDLPTLEFPFSDRRRSGNSVCLVCMAMSDSKDIKDVQGLQGHSYSWLYSWPLVCIQPARFPETPDLILELKIRDGLGAVTLALHITRYLHLRHGAPSPTPRTKSPSLPVQ